MRVRRAGSRAPASACRSPDLGMHTRQLVGKACRLRQAIACQRRQDQLDCLLRRDAGVRLRHKVGGHPRGSAEPMPIVSPLWVRGTRLPRALSGGSCSPTSRDLATPIVGSPVSTPRWLAIPSRRGWAMPWPSTMRRSGGTFQQRQCRQGCGNLAERQIARDVGKAGRHRRQGACHQIQGREFDHGDRRPGQAGGWGDMDVDAGDGLWGSAASPMTTCSRSRSWTARASATVAGQSAIKPRPRASAPSAWPPLQRPRSAGSRGRTGPPPSDPVGYGGRRVRSASPAKPGKHLGRGDRHRQHQLFGVPTAASRAVRPGSWRRWRCRRRPRWRSGRRPRARRRSPR